MYVVTLPDILHYQKGLSDAVKKSNITETEYLKELWAWILSAKNTSA